MNKPEFLFEDYPVIVFRDLEDEEPTWYAYLPDFGFSTCSGNGDDQEEALISCRYTYIDVKGYYLETGKEFPKPFSKHKLPKGW